MKKTISDYIYAPYDICLKQLEQNLEVPGMGRMENRTINWLFFIKENCETGRFCTFQLNKIESKVNLFHQFLSLKENHHFKKLDVTFNIEKLPNGNAYIELTFCYEMNKSMKNVNWLKPEIMETFFEKFIYTIKRLSEKSTEEERIRKANEGKIFKFEHYKTMHPYPLVKIVNSFDTNLLVQLLLLEPEIFERIKFYLANGKKTIIDEIKMDLDPKQIDAKKVRRQFVEEGNRLVKSNNLEIPS